MNIAESDFSKGVFSLTGRK